MITSELGSTLRQARETAGLSLAGMARRTGYSRSYLGNVESGVRRPTPAVIRAYERALGEQDVNRRHILVGLASTAVAAAAPDVAVDVVRDIAAERDKLLSTAQTTHDTDRLISSLIAKDRPSLGSLIKWMRSGGPVLRVNAAGILAKVGIPAMDNDVIRALKADDEARQLYLTAVTARVLRMPWSDAGRAATEPLAEDDHLAAFAAEARNPYDSGARWCSLLTLARTRVAAPAAVDGALRVALRSEPCRENLRAIAGTLAGLDPLTV